MPGLIRFPRKGDVVYWPKIFETDRGAGPFTITRRDSRHPGIVHMIDKHGNETLFIARFPDGALNAQATILETEEL